MIIFLLVGFLDNVDLGFDNFGDFVLCLLMVGEFLRDCGFVVKVFEGEWCLLIGKELVVVGWCVLFFDVFGFEVDWRKGEGFLDWEGLGLF